MRWNTHRRRHKEIPPQPRRWWPPPSWSIPSTSPSPFTTSASGETSPHITTISSPMSISLPRELLPSQLSIQLGVRLPILHLLDHIEPPLPEFPFFLHCSLFHFLHLHPLNHLLQDRVPLHQLVPPMALRYHMSSCLSSPAHPAVAELTFIDWQLLARFPFHQVFQANHSPLFLLQELLQ